MGVSKSRGYLFWESLNNKGPTIVVRVPYFRKLPDTLEPGSTYRGSRMRFWGLRVSVFCLVLSREWGNGSL